MNYLAHLLLAGKSSESQLGNLLGDFIKGNLEQYKFRYSEGIIRGIITHRKVDGFTDTHSIYIRSKRRIVGNNRPYSGVIIDISYDHFLSKNWEIFSEEKLEVFINNIYRLLQQNQNILPASLQQALPSMIAENWLDLT